MFLLSCGVTGLSLAMVLGGTKPANGAALVEISKKVIEHKGRLLTYSGGVSIFGDVTVEIDSPGAITKRKRLQSTVAWNWPRLYVESSDVRAKDNHRATRQAIYEYEVHKTTTYSKNPEPGIPMEVRVTPQRDTFSSDYAFVMRHLHWAEGEQSFRFGDEEANRELMTIPECFLNSGDYQIVGEEDVGGVRCLHITGPGDDIWLAIEHGYLVHRRDSRSTASGKLLARSEIQQYREIDADLWLPNRCQVTHFDANASTQFEENGVRMREQFWMRELGLGRVPVSLSQIEIPPGSHIIDVGRGMQFKPEPVLEQGGPLEWDLWRSPMVLGNAIALVLVVGWCVQRYAFGGPRSKG